MSGIVIYTDLDGSLLDHHDYSHTAADALLSELERSGVPVVPCTSKTRTELLPLREELNNHHPFIAENGAGVFIPVGYFPAQPAGTRTNNGFWVKTFTRTHQYWLNHLDSIAKEFKGEFESLSRMDTVRISELTGLNANAAERATSREYGEPVHWLGTESGREAFINTLQKLGAQVLRGGRFLHVSGSCDKGQALSWLNRQYALANQGVAPISLAIGDSDNDVHMLEAADYALLIRSPAHDLPRLSCNNNILTSNDTGPRGWNEGVRRTFSLLQITLR